MAEERQQPFKRGVYFGKQYAFHCEPHTERGNHAGRGHMALFGMGE
jgi:hypothetical protein